MQSVNLAGRLQQWHPKWAGRSNYNERQSSELRAKRLKCFWTRYGYISDSLALDFDQRRIWKLWTKWRGSYRVGEMNKQDCWVILSAPYLGRDTSHPSLLTLCEDIVIFTWGESCNGASTIRQSVCVHLTSFPLVLQQCRESSSLLATASFLSRVTQAVVSWD